MYEIYIQKYNKINYNVTEESQFHLEIIFSQETFTNIFVIN